MNLATTNMFLIKGKKKMAVQQFLARIGGMTQQVLALVISSGVADAGKIVATDETGKLDKSVMPLGIEANTIAAVASEAITAGKFVNFFSDSGTFSIRLADNANNRRADGFIIEDVSLSDNALVYPLDGTNSHMTGLTAGSRYWLGTSGGVTATPLDENDLANKGKLSQMVGIASSATEIVTSDHELVIL